MTVRWVGFVVLALAAVAAGHGRSSAEQLRGGVVGYGPTPSAGIAAGGWVLHGTVGQPVVGASADRTQILNHGFWCFGGSRVLAVGARDPSEELPTSLALGAPAPNPARREASFELALPRPARVVLGAYDLQGRRVEVIVDRDLAAGYHPIRWRTPRGAQVYFVRLTVDGARVGERRIVVLP